MKKNNNLSLFFLWNSHAVAGLQCRAAVSWIWKQFDILNLEIKNRIDFNDFSGIE